MYVDSSDFSICGRHVRGHLWMLWRPKCASSATWPTELRYNCDRSIDGRRERVGICREGENYRQPGVEAGRTTNSRSGLRRKSSILQPRSNKINANLAAQIQVMPASEIAGFSPRLAS